MASKSGTILFVIFSVMLACEVASGVGLVGGWKPIKDPNAPEVVEIAKFAVNEHNKQSSGLALSFVSVSRGEYQVVSGTNYKLFIDAHSGTFVGGAPGSYKAVVYDQPWTKTRKLISFEAVH